VFTKPCAFDNDGSTKHVAAHSSVFNVKEGNALGNMRLKNLKSKK